MVRDTWYALELYWQAVGSTIELTGRFGTSFGTLADKVGYVDPSPIANPFGVGIAHVDNNLVANECYFETTECDKV